MDRRNRMTHSTLNDLIRTFFIDTDQGPELAEFTILPISQVVEKIEQSDVTLWLSWAGGVLLTEAIKKVKEADEYNVELPVDSEEDQINVEDVLTEQEKAMLYGAFLVSSGGSYNYESESDYGIEK